MQRSQMTKKERESRSRLKQYLNWGEFVRGTLSVRERVCGKPNCRCSKGYKHVSLFLIRSKNGKIEQLYIPREKEDMVRGWVRQYRKIQDLLETISSIYWDRLKKGE